MLPKDSCDMWPVLIKEKEVVWAMFNGMYFYFFNLGSCLKLFRVSIIFVIAAFYMYPEGSAIVSLFVWGLFFVLQDWCGTIHQTAI